MNAQDFLHDSPGQLVAIPEGGVAFVPHSIPKSLTLGLRTLRLHGEAENAIGTLAGMLLRELNPYLVSTPLLRREALLSSRIEGTYTTPQDLVVIEALDDPPILQGGAADGREVANYVKAMSHGLRQLRTLPVSLRLLREVHAVLLKGVRGGDDQPGEFRTSQNFIGNKGEEIARARFVPPPAPYLNDLLDDFEKYIHDDDPQGLPLLIRLALLHYQFETIHPFRDGNGRIGRLLVPLLLCSTKRVEKPLVYISSHFEKHRDEYMNLMLAVSQRGEWTPWINFFLEAVVASSNESRQQAENLLDLRLRYLRQFQSARSSALLQKLIDRLFVAPVVTISQAAEHLSVTPAAASYNIQKLVRAGILERLTEARRNQLFIAREITNLLQSQ